MLVERIVEGSKIDVPITYAISGNEITYSTNPEVRGVFKLDPTTRPKTFDLDVVSKDGKVGDKWMGIYAIEGDTLKICTCSASSLQGNRLRGRRLLKVRKVRAISSMSSNV